MNGKALDESLLAMLSYDASPYPTPIHTPEDLSIEYDNSDNEPT